MQNQLFTNRSFESRLLLILGMIASTRILIGSLQDLFGQVSWVGVLIDLALLGMFLCITYYAFINTSFKIIHPLFGVVFGLLVALLFIRSGGIEGTTEYNFFGLMVILTLIYHGRWQKILLIISFIFFIYFSYCVYSKNMVFELLFVRNSWGYDSFLFTLIALAILTAYLQVLIESEDKKINDKNKELRTKVRLVSIKNAELNKQQVLLTKLNKQLEDEINERKAYHEERIRALQLYMEQHTEKIQLPINNLKDVIRQVGKPYPIRYQEMLNTSMNDIHEVVDSIKSTLDAVRTHEITPEAVSHHHENKP